MRVIIAILLLLTLSYSLFSQEITVGSIPATQDERGTQYIIGKKDEKTYVFRIPNDHKSRVVKVYFGTENTPMFAARPEISNGVSNTDEAISNVENYFTKNQYYYLDIYDAQMNLIHSKKIDALIKWNPRYRSESKIIFPRKLYFKDGEIMVISTYYESDINKLSVGYSKLDEDGNLGKNLNVFAEISSNNNDIEKYFHLQFSPDSSKLLVYGNLEDKNKRTFTLVAKLFDTKNFKLIQENEFTFSQKDKYLKIEDVKTDNYCNLWVLLQRKCFSEIHQRAKIPYFDYNLFCCQKGNNSLEEINIGISETNQIQHIAVEVDDNGTYLSGSYSPKNSLGHTGIFLQKIDPRTLQSQFNYLIPYSSDLSLDKTNFFHTRQIKQLKNNHYLIIAENYSSFLGLEMDGTIGRGLNERPAYGQYLYLVYDQILLIDVNENGEVAWMKKVPKIQQSVNTDGEACSYIVNLDDNKISFFFNAAGVGMISWKDKKWPECGLKLYQFDYSGNYTSKELYKDISTETSMIPKGSKVIGNNEVILYNNCKDGKFRYSKVKL